ncbi:unnamed protein product [Caenorhabditis brenneri]
MSDDLRDNKFVPRSIFTHFTTGATPEETLALLLRSHEKFPKFYPRIDYQEVEFWYDSFRNENYDLNQEPIHPEHTKFEKLPPLTVLDKIVHNVNTNDQKALRHVCHNSRVFIDNQNRLFDEIQFRTNSKSMMFQLTSGIDGNKTLALYKPTENGCEVIKNGQRSQFGMNFEEKAFEDFSSTIEVMHTKIKKLVIKHNTQSITEDQRQTFITKIVSVLNNLKQKLHVEALEITIKTSDELIAIMNQLKVGSLKDLELCRCEADVPGSVDMKKVINATEHWSHLHSLHSIFVALNLQLADFALIKDVHVSMTNDFSVEELLNHKNTILQQSDFNCHLIGPLFRHGQLEEWKTALEPFISGDDGGFDDENVLGKIPWPNQKDVYLECAIRYPLCLTRKKFD